MTTINWKKYAADFSAMTAVAAWEAAGRPREKV